MVSAIQEYCGPLISVNNSNDETLGHTEDYYFLFLTQGNRHPLPPPLAQNVKSARQRRTKDAPK